MTHETSNLSPLTPEPSDQRGSAADHSSDASVQGVCHACFAFDVGFAISLDDAEKALFADSRRTVLQKKKRAPQSIPGPGIPLSITVATESMDLGGFHIEPTVDLVFYSFGAVSVRFIITLHCPFEHLAILSDALYDHQPLAARAREHVERAIASLGNSISKPRIAAPTEDYIIFELDAAPDESSEVFVSRQRATVARILRAERESLSSQEMDDAMSLSIAYGPADRAVIDWHAALLVGPDAADVRSILEYANVQLVQMRSLDDELEHILDSSYELLARFKGLRRTFLGIAGGQLRRLGMLHADSAILFEDVSHSMKLVGDQYLARVYRAVSQRFHLPQWGANINRKLQAIDTIYDKITDRQTTVRMEVLEWIIIILILIEVIKGFWPS